MYAEIQYSNTTYSGTVLIVDDNSNNLGVLSECLNNTPYEILIARDGKSAIEKAIYALPNLILLDIMMPVMDGFEACKLLKEDVKTQNIPIIFMTALADIDNKIKGFNLGAVDYITKPFQKEEVIARIATHIQISKLQRKLEERNLQLSREVKKSTESQAQLKQAIENLQDVQSQLIHSEKMSSLGRMVAGIAHEINNPISFIKCNIEHLERYSLGLMSLLKLYHESFPDATTEIESKIEEIDLDFLMSDLPKLLQSMRIGSGRVNQVILNLRGFSRLDEADVKSVNIHDGLESSLMILKHRLKSSGEKSAIQVFKDYGELPPIACYSGQLNQVFLNLITNSIDALNNKRNRLSSGKENGYNSRQKDDSRESGLVKEVAQYKISSTPSIWISTKEISENKIEIRIGDNGCGIPAEIQSCLFDPFFTTKDVGEGTGLGLSISHKIIVEKHGGSLTVESIQDKMTEFIIQLPTAVLVA